MFPLMAVAVVAVPEVQIAGLMAAPVEVPGVIY
jgi:hypothetical protein